MLLPGEQELWRRMSGPDRRHGAAVARRAIELLKREGREEVGREVVAAALLHDVGKVEAGLGTFARVGATLAAMVAGRERWSQAQRGLSRRVATYLSHDKVGAELLRRAGSHGLTVEWARQHHLPAKSWTLDAAVARALKEADGD